MSATEGLAFGGLILSLFLGYLNYRANREARDDTHALARESRQATGEEARAARLFDARRSVYVDAMDYAFLIETIADRMEPIFSMGAGDPAPPDFPPEAEQRRQSAQVAVFGSKAVRDKLMELKRATIQFRSAVWRLRSERQFEEHGKAVSDAWSAVGEKRDALKALVVELIELINAELTG
jgi:hypothetical protein